MLRQKPIAATALAGLLLVPAFAMAAVDKYKLDPAHTEVGFTVRHFVSKVAGRFNQFDGDVSIDPKDHTTLTFSAKIQTASIDTNNERRDGHLRSSDFFDAETHPEISFKSKKVEKNGDKLKVTGDLTMRGVTKEITLDVAVLGFAGNKAGFEATGTLNRKDWGVLWNKTLDQGGTMLSDEVDLVVRVEANAVEKDQANK
jgi:polyisoprenoid-binding protein YceI